MKPEHPVVPWLIGAAIYGGLLLSTTVVGVISYDLLAARMEWKSFSREAHDLSRTGYWAWTAVVLIGMLSFAVGVLAGHLYFPQYVGLTE